MKKLLTFCILAAAVCGCHKKMSPSAPVVTPAVVAVDSIAVNAKNAADMGMVASGKTVYEAKCSKCHGLKDPAKYTQERWVGLVNWMAPRAKVVDDEKAQILAHVQHNAKDAIK